MLADRLDLAALITPALVLCMADLLLGCAHRAPRQTIGPIAMVLPQQADLCGLVRLDRLIGQDFVSLADQPLVGTLRVVWPGQDIMSGVVPTRLNAQVSDEGLILGLSCG